jgi:hypothetical protein
VNVWLFIVLRHILVHPSVVFVVFVQNSYCTVHQIQLSVTVLLLTVFEVLDVYAGSATIVGTVGAVVSIFTVLDVIAEYHTISAT